MAARIKDHSFILIVHANPDSSDDISNFNGFLHLFRLLCLP